MLKSRHKALFLYIRDSHLLKGENMFVFCEDFKRYDENYKPYGIDIEACSTLWHKHIRADVDGMAIATCGNKYFLKAPSVSTYSAEYEFSFNYISNSAAITLYSGYERVDRSGYEIVLFWNGEEEQLYVTLRTLLEDRTDTEVKRSVKSTFSPMRDKTATVTLTVNEESISIASTGSDDVIFFAPSKMGEVGFGRPNYIGEVIFRKAKIAADLEIKTVAAPVKVEIPLNEGGSMPLTVEYELYECCECRYLKATLDGGPQYRQNYKYYDPEGTREQYIVEHWYITKPYVTYGKNRFYLSMGEINTSDGLHWKGILDVYLGMVEFPVTVTFPVGREESDYGFGYENLRVEGYLNQNGKAEYSFSKNGEYLGEVSSPDTFTLLSPENKCAVSMIEDTVYEAESVREHFRRSHFFAEGESIDFAIKTNTDKKYITYKAELRTVYDELIEPLTVDKEGKITHAPMPVGVYRIHLFVYYGDEILTELDTVFEVFDKEGKKCPPLEAGLPVLFSMPNEQKYLDRDRFDPWSPPKAYNAEHFYALSTFVGYVAERKRVWEVVRKFGRELYSWCNRRSYGSREAADYKKHTDLIKNSKYIAYPQKYEWDSMRSDFMARCYWPEMTELCALLDKFLDERVGAREKLGLARGGKVTQEVVDNLYKYYQHEWYDYACAAITEELRSVNKSLTELNPNWKRAHYGPVTVYGAMLRSYPLSRSYGFNVSDFLSDEMYTGFCQLEDYPSSCAYQTLRGAFTVGTLLAKFPRLVIHPEQYTSSRGGCIDGHVKHANPPLGKCDIPIWFNTTHAREFVYNAAVKTPDGYRFWDTYGFMHRDLPECEDDYFVKNWKHVISHKPKSLMKSPVFFAEFPESEDLYETEFIPDKKRHVVYNVSEEGIAHLYEVSRLFGLPMGSFASWEALDTLTKDDTDLIILPTTVGLSEERLLKIRKLHSEGVALFATSRVDGLEDLFGVEYAPEKKKFFTVEALGESEDVYPFTEAFNYKSSGAEVRMRASGNPVYFTYGKTALLNLAAYSVGRTHFKEHPYLGRATNSDLYYKVTAELLRELTSPLAVSDGSCGITLFNDESGNELLLAIDYSRHDPSELERKREYKITLNLDYTDCVSLDGKPVRKLISEKGRLDGIVVTLRQHESALIKLIR